jgi:hypothetical protein
LLYEEKRNEGMIGRRREIKEELFLRMKYLTPHLYLDGKGQVQRKEEVY